MGLEPCSHSVVQPGDVNQIVVWDRAAADGRAMMKRRLLANRSAQHAPELRRRDAFVVGAFSVESAVLGNPGIGNIDSV